MNQDNSNYNPLNFGDRFVSGEHEPKRRRTSIPSRDSMSTLFRSYNSSEVRSSPPRPLHKKRHPRFQPLTLLGFDEPHREGVAQLDALVCRNVELFQSFADEGPQSAQFGLRCVHCARAMQRHVDSCIIFPSSVETMANSLRMMIERHFPKCDMLPSSVRDSFDASRRARQNNLKRSAHSNNYARESSKLECEALSSFLEGVCRNANIMDRQPAQTGIVQGSALEPMAFPAVYHEDTSTSALSYSNLRAPIPQPPSPYKTNEREGNVIMFPATASSGKRPSQQHYQQPSSSYQTHGAPSYNNMPFLQTAQNIWECRYCLTQPVGHRAERYAWYAPSPPDNVFMDDHLRHCTGRDSCYQDMQSNQQSRQHQPAVQHHQQSYSPSSNMYNMQSSARSNQQENPQPQSQMHYGSSYPPPSYPPNNPSYNQQYRTQQSSLNHQFGQQSSTSWNHSPTTFSGYNQSQQYSTPPGPSHSHKSNRDSNRHPGVEACKPNSGSLEEGRSSPTTELPDTSAKASIDISEVKEATDYLIKMERKSIKLGSALVEDEDKYLITDYFYHVMKQLHICHFKENDRTTRGGKRDNIKIGYGGLECIHCSDTQNQRKFFWSNVDRLSNSFSEIPGHLLKCKACPELTKRSLQELKKYHPTQMMEKSRGSQKTFLRRVWRRMHECDSKETELGCLSPEIFNKFEVLPTDSIVSLGSESPGEAKNKSPQSSMTTCTSIEEAAKILASPAGTAGKTCRVVLAIDQDKQWGLSDIDIFARKNLELFCATESDVKKYTAEGDQVVSKGQVGLRCVSCLQSKEEKLYVTFPSSLDELFSVVRAYNSKHLPSCSCLSKEERERYDSLNESSSSSFGSIVREYYYKAAEALGLRDASGSGGIRAGGKGGFRQAV